MKYKKQTWLVYYRTDSGVLGNFEAPENVTEKEVALTLCKSSTRKFKDFEKTLSGEPIVKRLCYI